MYCPNCGKKADEGQFCSQCGYNFSGTVQKTKNDSKINKNSWRKTKKWRIMKVCYWIGMPILGSILWIIANASCGTYCYDSWGPVAFILVLLFMGPLYFLFRWIVGYIIGHDSEKVGFAGKHNN